MFACDATRYILNVVCATLLHEHNQHRCKHVDYWKVSVFTAVLAAVTIFLGAIALQNKAKHYFAVRFTKA
jgi:hypothetical protein